MHQRTAIALIALTASCASAGGHRAAPSRAVTERGTVRTAAGARDFIAYTPAASLVARAGDGALVVMLHGCTQDAADIGRGTRLDEWADREGFTVLYPEQPASANPLKCWNWFVPAQTARDEGEVGLLGAMIDSLARARGIAPGRIAVVGNSAGAAMAASLVIAYPRRYGALVIHSGVPAGAAHDQASAIAMMRGATPNGTLLGRATHAAMGADARAIPVLVLHGADDKVVTPANLDAIALQWSVMNALAERRATPRPATAATPRARATPGFSLDGQRVPDASGRTGVEWWRIGGLGHAWSGGSPDGTYTVPTAPDATAMVVSFLREVWAARGER